MKTSGSRFTCWQTRGLHGKHSSYGCSLDVLARINTHYFIFIWCDRLGPFITGAIYTATNDYRKAFWFPLGLIIIGVVILLQVDVDLGKDQARQFAADKREMKAKRAPF